MLDMVIMIGLQGSGKSTFCAAHYPEYTRINLDTLRTRKKEHDTLLLALNRKENIIIDNTNPTKDDRKKYIQAGRAQKYKIIGCFMQSRLQDCIERNNARTGKDRIPDIAISCTANKLELPYYDEGFDELYYVKITDAGFTATLCRETGIVEE